MRPAKRILLAVFIILLSVGCDQMTKAGAAAYLPKSSEIQLADGIVTLHYHENEGGVFFFESVLPEKWQGKAVTVATSLCLGLIIVALLFVPGLRFLSVVGLSLFCGGSLGNLLDRIAFGGDVIDFLSLGWGDYRTYIFNVADVAIMAGGALLLLSVLWGLGSIVSGRRTRSKPGAPG